MKKRNTIIKKSLSVFLSAVMLFTMLAVGIIIPDAKVEADALTTGQTITVNSVSAINSAISTANSAGANTVTTIRLSGNISGGETAAFTTITGYVKFDFNGYYIKFEYNNTDLGNNDNSNTEQQLPSDLQSSYTSAQAYDTVNKGFFNVGTAGTLQLVNTSSTNSSLEVRTYAYGDDGNAHHATSTKYTTTWMTTSSAIRSEGTLIIGDKDNSGYNNFTVLTQARSGTDSDGYDKRCMAANSYAVTVDNSNAKLFMYGGTLTSMATCRGNYSPTSNARCFPLNINNCYCAEVYGGNVNILGDDECGVRNSDKNKTTGGVLEFASIRINCPNVFIFNVNSAVNAYAGADTGSAQLNVMNIFVPNNNALPCIYGGKYENTASGVAESSAAWERNYTIRGKFRYADGVIQSGDKSVYINENDNGGVQGFNYKYRSGPATQYFYTMFYCGTTETENGKCPWDYNTFRDYVAARTSTTDVYFNASTYTHINDGTSYAVDTNYKYRRNGYAYNSWLGSKMAGSYGGSTYANSGAAGFNAAAGGSIFLFPKWVENTYTITYDLNDTTGNNSASNASGAPTSYKITSTSALPTPTRSGYSFGGWMLDSKTFPKVGGGTTTNISESTDTVNDSWMQASTYAAGTSLNGKNGNIVLKALWTEIPYTVTFDWDNIPAGASGTKTTTTAGYNVNSTFTFPTGCAKDYYTFNNVWKTTTAGGSFAAGNTFGAGDTSAAGSYGSPTFTAQYTPVDYYVTFDPNNGASISPNYETTNANIYKYNYESNATLPTTTRLGYTFTGWRPANDTVSDVWSPLTTYPAGTSLLHKHDNVTLIAQWESVTSTVTLSLGTGENISGNTSLPYAYANSLELNNPSKTGYTFSGWKVSVAPSNYTADIPASSRWSVDTVYSLGNESNVTLPANMIGDVTLVPVWTPVSYRLEYNSNGGTACDPKSYTIADTFILATPARNGYSFTGWSVAEHDDVYNWTASTYSAGQSVSGRYGNVKLTASWAPVNYTVTLDVNGGNALADNTLDYDIEGATSLPVPTRTGYTFAGWKLTAADASSDWTTYTGRPENDIYTDALPQGHYGSLTLTAQWTHQQYTITLNTNGTNGDPKTYYIDSPSFTLGSSELPGYTFKKWVVNADAGSWTKDSAYLATAAIVGMYGDVTLSAVFDANEYTVTYLDKDGEQDGTAQTYTIEDTLTLRSYAEDGYEFTGWKVKSVSAGGGWNVGDEIPAGELTANMYYGNVVLEPVLTAKEYTVTYIPDGGTSYPQATYTIETDDLTLPAPTKTGYDFAGWKVTTAAGSWTENAVFEAGTSVAGKFGSVTLTATWTAKKFAITYIVGNTTLYPAGITKQGTFAQTAPDLTDAEKAKPSDAQYDYTFDHWDPALKTVSGEATYTAVYTETLRSYDIKWMIPDDVGGTLTNYTASTTPSVDYGTTPVYNNGVNPVLTSDSPENYSWRFVGWATTAGGTVLDSLPAVTGTATYYAVFNKVLAPEEVNWVINGVTNTELWGIGETPSWQHDTPAKPDENGYKYTFTGWTPTIVPVVQGNTYTYTAQFTPELQTYNYTLNLAGGEMTEDAGGTYKMGDAITFPAPTKTGYTFAGWSLDAAVGSWTADTTISAGDYITNTLWGSVSFTAKWTPVEYTITFNKSAADDTVPAAKTYTIESTDALGTATRDGYELSGWIVATAAGNWTQGAKLDADYVLAENYGNVTLTPVWQVKSYKIYWVSGEATQESEVEYGSAILAFPPSSRMGYTAEWDNEVPATMPANDLTFTAVYTPVEYYIRINVNGGEAIDNFYYTINGDNTLPTPVRDGATFAGWKVTAAAGNWSKNTTLAGGASLNGKYGNVTLTAQWNMRTCTVIWEAGDTTRTTVWYYGSLPSFDGTPYKSPDEYNSYVFTGWDKAITPVTEDEVTYTALFEATERMYTVTWNIDGNTVSKDYKYGETPVYEGSTPVRPSTSEYDFTFSGWSPEVGEVTKDITYVAQFNVFTKIQGLSLDISAAVVDIAETDTLRATIYPATATVKDVMWTSMNPDVVSIDSYGRITGVKAGIAVVKVSSVDEKFNSFCVVTVNAIHTQMISITANGVSTTQLKGSGVQLYATLVPDDATDTTFTWSSKDSSIASVDQNGFVTFGAVGKTEIIARASDGFAVGSIEVCTTTNEEDIKDTAKTYRVSFASAASQFIIVGPDGSEHAFKEITVIYPEATEVRFKLADSSYTALANGCTMKTADDGYYHIDSIDRNYAIIDELFSIGLDDIDPDPGKNDAPSFFARLQAFLRKIVEFFRNLFKR